MRPSAASAWISFQKSRRALGSTPAVGSSSSSSCGLGSVQAPSASRCFQPPDNSPAICSSRPARPSRSIAARAARDRLGDAVDAGDEFQVLAHREVLVEAEALGHVADLALDLVGLGADVVAEAGAVAFVGREQPAQHADGGGLAGAVGPEEAVDRAALDLHRQVAHHRPAVEFLGQVMDVDDDVAAPFCAPFCALISAPLSAASRSPAGRRGISPDGRAAPRSGTRAWRAHPGCRSPAACIPRCGR